MATPKLLRFALPMQVAAVCYRRRGNGVEFLLVNSNGGNKWTFPKGSPETTMSHSRAAEKEAWEEAGLVGTLREQPIGEYRFEKLGRTHRVVVFRMKVTKVKRDWPERDRRRRRWLRPDKAVDRIEDAQLRKIVDAVARLKRAA